jgi:Multiubiquitin
MVASQPEPAAHSKPFKLMVDQHLYEWNDPKITGAQIKALASVDPSFGVWQEIPGPNDPPVADNQEVSLEGRGVERFFTGKKTTTEG